MTFNQINYFLTVAKCLSFTRAATELFVTQSTLSRSIQALETEVGASLLTRDYHSVTLTPAGELFYTEMDPLISNIYAVIRKVQDVSKRDQGVITLGLLDGMEVESPVLFALRNMADRYPQLELKIRRLPEGELVDQLKKGNIDIVETILPVGKSLDEGHVYHRIREVRRYFVARKDDPIWEHDFSISALHGKTLLIMEQWDMATEEMKEFLARRGIHPTYKTAQDTETLSLWLESGMGYTIVNEGNIIYSSKAFRPIRVEQITEFPGISTVLVWKESNVNPELEMFLTFIRSDISKE